jgi:hypothetical protein
MKENWIVRICGDLIFESIELFENDYFQKNQIL